MQTLEGLRVLQIGRTVAACYGAKLLAGFGAEVYSLAAPDAQHSHAPHEDESDPLETVWFERGCRRLNFDWAASQAPSELRKLLERADILIDAGAPDAGERFGLNAAQLAKDFPRLIVCRITPFGLSGPCRDWQANDLTLYAMSGLATSTGDGMRAPLNARPRIAQTSAGLYAYIACLMALLRREREGVDGLGDFIDLSIQEAAMENYEIAIAEQLHSGKIARRNADEHAMVPWRTYPCADGEATIIGGPIRHWLEAVSMFDEPRLAQAPFADAGGRITHRKEFESLLRPWLDARRRQDIFHLGQARGLAWSYLAMIGEALDDPQHQARGFFETLHLDDGRSCRVPGAPFRASASPWNSEGCAPACVDAAALAQRWAKREHTRAADPQPESALSLKGIRVLDFTHDWAGPHAARVLADYGAEVVKIEFPRRLDGMRGGYPEKVNGFARFWQLHRNKRSVTLDLARPEHLAICEQLARDCDLVIENSRPGVMDKLGLGYARLRELKPDIVMLSMSAFGANGPYAAYAGYGGTIEALSGLQSLTGYAADGPRYRVREIDVLNGIFGICAAITALRQRQLSGAGQWIDLSETETCAWLIGEFFARRSADGEEPAPPGNRHLWHAPQGIYPCAGEDRWLALSVRSDGEWRRLAQVIGGAALDSGYATMAQRRARHDALDALIAAWTRSQEPGAAAQRLQALGLAAGPVMNAADLAGDAHLAARGWFEEVAGLRLPGLPFRSHRGSGRVLSKGPDLGRDNAWLEQRYGRRLEVAEALKPENLGTGFEPR